MNPGGRRHRGTCLGPAYLQGSHHKHTSRPGPAGPFRRQEAGATGLIFGRNVWQRPRDESLRVVAALKEILAKYPSA